MLVFPPILAHPTIYSLSLAPSADHTLAWKTDGSGFELRDLADASLLSRGTIPDARLSGNVPLMSGGKLNASNLPSIAITDTSVVNSQAAMLALTAQVGDLCVRSDLSETFILQGSDPTQLSNWVQLLSPTSPVQSVNGLTGAVTLTTGQIGEGSNLYFTNARARGALTNSGPITYDNTTGTIGISLAGLALTGVPTAPTAAADTNTTQLATCAFVVGQASTAAPLSDSNTAAVGTSKRFARADHVHALPSNVGLTDAENQWGQRNTFNNNVGINTDPSDSYSLIVAGRTYLAGGLDVSGDANFGLGSVYGISALSFQNDAGHDRFSIYCLTDLTGDAAIHFNTTDNGDEMVMDDNTVDIGGRAFTGVAYCEVQSLAISYSLSVSGNFSIASDTSGATLQWADTNHQLVMQNLSYLKTWDSFEVKIASLSGAPTVLYVGHTSTNPALGFFGVTPAARQAIGNAATDASSTQTLANNIRTALINLGLCKTS